MSTDHRDLVIAEVFGPTFQGEGASLGQRAGFVRLGRCNLDCSWCDTPYTWDWSRFDPAEELSREATAGVLARLEPMRPDLVVITGGEPLLQQTGLVGLLEGCLARGWSVEVETNGTIAPLPALVPLVQRWNVSPKLANSGVSLRQRIRPDALAGLLATGAAVFKFVVTQVGELDEVADIVNAHQLRPVWIMPEGRDTPTIVDGARRLADGVLERGWNLSPRLHVLLWGDERGR